MEVLKPQRRYSEARCRRSSSSAKASVRGHYRTLWVRFLCGTYPALAASSCRVAYMAQTCPRRKELMVDGIAGWLLRLRLPYDPAMDSLALKGQLL